MTTTTLHARSPVRTVVSESTIAGLWEGLTATPLSDELLHWPPDVLALTGLVLERAEGHRFVLSPPLERGWPPADPTDWSEAVGEAARGWCTWAEDPSGPLPDLVTRAWKTVLRHADTLLSALADGEPWPACEALLTLHAIADEACAGLFTALDRGDGLGCVYRARGRELLARTGTLAQIHPDRVRVMPRILGPVNGHTPWARYASVLTPGLKTRWRKIPSRQPGTEPRVEALNHLLLPWPLRVRASDFRAVGPVHTASGEPHGFFEFSPAEPLDLELVEDLLLAALDEVGSVASVVLPECAIEPGDIGPLEAVLARHGVACLVAGVREPATQPGRFGANWIHVGQQMVRGGSESDEADDTWYRMRQNKHHRWSLDESQVNQYHLGGALHPKVRWWEAMEIPSSSLELIQVGEGITFALLVCEDLAQNDAVSEVIRAVGPTIVMTLLLDGPQVRSRWAARYASVLADDPGSAVFTLSSAGMVVRSRPHDRPASRVIGLWKDAEHGAREIELEPGAQGVVVTTVGASATRATADGRAPAVGGPRYSDAAIHQIRARPKASQTGQVPRKPDSSHKPPLLDLEEITVLTGWAEGVAEALAHAPERVSPLLAEARADAAWREQFGVARPSPTLDLVLSSIATLVAASGDGVPSFAAALSVAQERRTGEQPPDALARQVLRSALEQLFVRRIGAAGRG